MLYGAKVDGTERWARKLTSEKMTISLSSGVWKFQAINWQTSSDAFEGDPTCAESSITIGGASAQIDLSLSKDTCKGSSWFSGVGYYEFTTTTSFMGFTVNLCPVDTLSTELESFTNCSFPTSTATGLKITLPEVKDGAIDPNLGLTSKCYSANENNFYTAAKLPFGSDKNFPMYSKVEVFNASNASCTGDECCAGASSTYHFPSGFGQVSGFKAAAPKVDFNIKLKLEEKVTSRFKIEHPTSAEYKSCQSITIGHVGSDDLPIPLKGTRTVDLTCTNCSYHSTSSCSSTALSQITFADNTYSYPLYVKIKGHKALMKASDSAKTITPAIASIKATVYYTTIDRDYLYSGLLSNFGYTTASPPFNPGDVIIYQTSSGHRGRMQINNMSTVSVANDSFNFDFETFSTSATLATNTSLTVTACFSGMCFVDLDQNAAVTSGGVAGIDLWWENLGGSLYFNPQGNVAFYLIQ